MIKKLRLYQIGFFIITFAFITLCAYMGITAVQKSMRLNVGFPASPTIKCQIDIKANGADDNTYTTIFNNNGEEIIGTGIELSGNMLKFTETFANAYATTLGGSFVLKITNLMTDTGIKITSSGTGATANPTYLAIKKSGSGADTGIMVVSGNSALATLQLSFSEYNEYNVIISPSSGNFTYTGNSVVVSGENYTATLKANTGYNLAITVVRNDGTLTTLVSGTDYAWNSSNGALTIYAGAITGDININCVNNTVITYTISYNLNGGAVATANPTSYNVNTSTFTLTNPTKTGYNFLGWTGSNGTTAQTSVTISKGVIGNKSYTANWQIKTFTINYSLTNCTSNQTSGASVNYGTSYTATITPSTINLLPTTITVSGVSSGGYSWNYSTGVFSISDWSKVTGNITIAIKAEVFRFVAYSGSQYTGPTARGGSAYAYYCEFGTYPQSYVGTNASVVSGMTSTSVTYAYDSAVTFYKLNGVNKYALVGSRYYAFEPIRWTVLGVDNAGTITFSGSGTAVTVASTSATLFTSATSGLTLSENRLKLNGTTQTKLLFLSEYGLDGEYFDQDSSYTNQWSSSDCDIRLFLNNRTTDMKSFSSISGLVDYYDTSSTHATGKYIQQTKIAKTSYVQKSEAADNGYYNMFLLGSNYMNDGHGTYYYNKTDSYNIASYFPIYTGTSVSGIRAYCAPYAHACGGAASGSPTTNTINYNTAFYWLRSGYYGLSTGACNVTGTSITDLSGKSKSGVRPAFTFNLG